MEQLVYRSTRNRKEMEAAVDCAVTSFRSTQAQYFRRSMLGDPTMTRDRVLACFLGERQIGGITIQRRDIRIGKAVLEVAAIANVGTLSEFRERGIASRLLDMVLDFMERNQVPISILYGGHPIYHAHGWTQLPIPTTHFVLCREKSSAAGAKQKTSKDITISPVTDFNQARTLFRLYDSYFEKINGGHIRDLKYWQWTWEGFARKPWVWFDNREDRFRWLAASKNGKPKASLILRTSKDKDNNKFIAIREWAYNDLDAMKALVLNLATEMRRRKFHRIEGRFAIPGELEQILGETGFEIRHPAHIDGMWRIGHWRSLWENLEPELSERYKKSPMPEFKPFSLTSRLGSIAFSAGKNNLKLAFKRVERDIIIEQVDLISLIIGARTAREMVWGFPAPSREAVNILEILFPRRGYVLFDSDHF